MKFQSILGFTLVLLLMISCSKDDNSVENVKGKYTIESFTYSSCTDASDNLSFTKGDNGLCATRGDEEACVEVCMEFTDDNYTVKLTISSGDLSFSVDSDGTFDRSTEKGKICIEGECNDIEVSNGGKTIEFAYTDPDNGCLVSMRLKRQ